VTFNTWCIVGGIFLSHRLTEVPILCHFVFLSQYLSLGSFNNFRIKNSFLNVVVISYQTYLLSDTTDAAQFCKSSDAIPVQQTQQSSDDVVLNQNVGESLTSDILFPAETLNSFGRFSFLRH
jgi:hypothetical protein